MVNTTNYELEKYEAGNSANLLDQYNASMDKIDHTGTETFTVTDLAKLKKTVEDYPIPPAE
jgi:hypothetical protein